MNLRIFVPLILTAGLAACSGGGASAPLGPTMTPPLQTSSSTKATGTLTFVIPSQHQASNSRRPDYVSPKTIHAALFIDGATTPAGSAGMENPPASHDQTAQSGPCSSTCTINWSTTAGQHTFVLEIDGDECQVASQTCVSQPDIIFAEGKTVAAVSPGSGNVINVTMNGVAVGAGWMADASSTANSVTGTYAVYDADDDLITTPGVFDNGPLSLSVSGTLATGSASVETAAGGTTLGAPDANGNDYPFSVSCSPAANGSFTIVTSMGSPSGDVTAAELSANGLLYPLANQASPFALTFPTYTCTNGVIANAGGGTGPDFKTIRQNPR
jgi:hypothetical protein